MNGNFLKTKKVLSAAVGAIMMLQGAAAVCAADIAPEAEVFVRPEVEEVQAVQIGTNYITVDVKISNVEKNDMPVIAYLLNDAGKMCAVSYRPILGGEASLTLGVSDSEPTGLYTLVIDPYLAGESYVQTFNFVGTEDVNNLMAAINDADKGSVKEKLDDSYIAFDTIYYPAAADGSRTTVSADDYKALSEAQRLVFAEKIASALGGKYADKKGTFVPRNAAAFVKEAYIVSLYNSKDTSDSLLAAKLYEYASVVGFDAEDAALYGKIDNKETMAQVAKNTNSTVENADELAKVILQAAAVQLVNETHWTNLVNVVEDIEKNYDGLFGIKSSDITKLKNNKALREEFCQNFKSTYYSVDEVSEAWADVLKAAEKKIGSTGGSTGGGGGTGGSAGGTSTGDTAIKTAGTSYTPQDNLEKTKLITDYYDDMSGDYSWASDAVLHLTLNGVVQGYGDRTFGPEKNLTRAEFMKMLVNVCGLADVTATCSFTDVDKDAWYYVYVASAEKVGLASGYGDGLFGVNDPITRQDAITLVYRAAKIKKISIGKYSVGALNFKDNAEIAPYAVEAVKALYGAGVYLDTAEVMSLSTLEPTKNASRAYLAVLLDQIYELK